MAALIFRLIFSLGFIAVLLWFAARVAKKRGLGGAGGHLIEVVARQRMSRSTSVNVIRIADRVFVVGATEEQITLLAEMEGEAVDEVLAEATRPADSAEENSLATDSGDIERPEPGTASDRGSGTDSITGSITGSSTTAMAVKTVLRRTGTPRKPRPGSTGGLMAGSVFDRAGWAALIDSLREKTVRRS